MARHEVDLVMEASDRRTDLSQTVGREARIMDAIVVDALEKTYRKGSRALDGMTFSVPEGQVFGLLGPNGAGKSTTVRILVTLSTADAGAASVAGHDVRWDPVAVRRSI